MLYFITSNNHKFAEVKALIPDVQQLYISLTEIQDADAEIVIRAKLKEASSHHKGMFIVEDTSLYMEALGGLPGPFIKWFLEKLGLQGLLAIGEKLRNNKAVAKTIIGYADGDVVQFFEGAVAGTIVSPRGESFGWDPIFLPEGETKTFAEMAKAKKNEISMRTIAVRKLKLFLEHAN